MDGWMHAWMDPEKQEPQPKAPPETRRAAAEADSQWHNSPLKNKEGRRQEP